MTPAEPGTEKQLEEWILGTPSMIGDAWTIVARQLSTAAGPLDLLAIDPADRWVVVELKRGALYRSAIAQAIDYAACIRDMSAADLRQRIVDQGGRLGRDAAGALERVDDVLSHEADDIRDVAVVVSGVGADAGVERVVGFLANFEVPIRVVSFSAFRSATGELTLVREILDGESDARPTRAQAASQKEGLASIQQRAYDLGVGEEFRRLIAAFERAGFYARPYTRSVMFTPPTHRNRYLAVATPQSNGRMSLSFGPEAIVEFYPNLKLSEVERLLGTGGNGLAGGDLRKMVERAEAFAEWLRAEEATVEHDT